MNDPDPLAWWFETADRITPQGQDSFLVSSRSEEGAHAVDAVEGTCSCKGWSFRRHCIHLLAAERAAWSARGWRGRAVYLTEGGQVQFLGDLREIRGRVQFLRK